jgi:hypothetical protein
MPGKDKNVVVLPDFVIDVQKLPDGTLDTDPRLPRRPTPAEEARWRAQLGIGPKQPSVKPLTREELRLTPPPNWKVVRYDQESSWRSPSGSAVSYSVKVVPFLLFGIDEVDRVVFVRRIFGDLAASAKLNHGTVPFGVYVRVRSGSNGEAVWNWFLHDCREALVVLTLTCADEGEARDVDAVESAISALTVAPAR